MTDQPATDAVTLYTDGSCLGNPGPGGWAVLLVWQDQVKELSGGEPQTTNNRMELQAAIEGLRALKRSCKVRLHTDSTYVRNAFAQRWLDRWQRNGWKTAAGQPVENRDLWQDLLCEVGRHQVEWIKVRAHAGDKLNNRCDALAKAACPTREPVK